MKKTILLIILFCVYSSSYAEISWEKCADSLDIVDSFLAYGDYVFIGTRSNGIIVSSDNGNSWSVRKNGLKGGYISDLANIDSIIFAIDFRNGIYYSSDFGLNWYPCNNGITDTTVGCLAESEGLLFTGGDKVFKSVDTGKTWIEILDRSNNGYILDISIDKSTIAAGGNRLVISTDNGKSWRSWEHISYSDTLGGLNSVSSMELFKDCLYLGSYGLGKYRTCDNGKNWEYNESKNISVMQYKRFKNLLFECETKDLNLGFYKDGQLKWKRFYQGDWIKTVIKIAISNNFIFLNYYDRLADIHTIYRHPIGILDEPDVKISGTNNVCAGDTVTYSSKYQKYLATKWRVEGGTLDSTSNDSLIKVIWQSPGSGKVIITKYNDLIELSDSTILEINIFEYPAKPKIRYAKDTLWSDSPDGNQWFKNGKELTGENKNYYYTGDSGSFSVQVTLNGCKSEMSDTINLDALGVEDTNETNVFSVSPNPATDYIEINLPSVMLNSIQHPGIKIYNIFGEELLLSLPGGEGVSSSSQYSILTTQYYRLDVSGFPPGLYFVRVGEKTGKFVKTE